uniref:Predicted transposase YdaD n=1 Tax=Candidatus Kentrum sp. LPFa TaxID=2126335 RepID=A0A450Y3I5_9GAMM|nr:MAG: Predicted transposase YdaD [Candidatus Kentron sp. LPFa]VFK36012.1 MAG: Predicted transposase YdaD [Candidatus Kentron sp. LPFa]
MADKDIVSKETIRRLAVDLATYLLELPIDPGSLEVLPTEHQRVEDRRADLVVKLRDRAGEPFLLHIEIQNSNDDAMPIRMLRYMTDILLAHPGLPLQQYLIYIGPEPLTMPDGIEGPGFRYRYGLRDMRSVDCRYLLEKDTPDALVLAILCDFGDREPQVVVNHIYTRLKALLGDDLKRFREYIAMLHILSDNRDLQAEIEEADKMLTQVDLERMPFYEAIMERGVRQGMERGMERGREEGEAVLLLRQLNRKFGPLPPEMERKIRSAEPQALMLWGDRVLDARTLDEVFL